MLVSSDSILKITRRLPTLNRLYFPPVSVITWASSDAGSPAYCSILEMTLSRSREARRRISLIALADHSILPLTPEMFAFSERGVKDGHSTQTPFVARHKSHDDALVWRMTDLGNV